MTDAELDGAESPEWIAVRKDGLTQLVQDLTEARIKLALLEAQRVGDGR